jgi:hypothetical protein
MLFQLDGTVSGNNAVDKVNGWLFPITGTIDWDITDKIFPFRTICTISAPADGTPEATAIQAKDVNNFWYAADGTANVIPFQYFYQNQDFEDKHFCKHIAQVIVDEWEITHAGVKDITLYNSAESAHIATMASYFGSEVEPIVGAKWASPLGNDTTGNGTRALPYLSIGKLCSQCNGITGYVLSGNYGTEGDPYYGIYRFTNPSYSIIGIGRVITNTQNQTAGAFRMDTSSNCSIAGIDFINTKWNLILTGTGNHTIVLSRMRLEATAINIINNNAGANGLITINDCTLNFQTYPLRNYILNRCLCKTGTKLRVDGKTLNVNYCKLIDDGTIVVNADNSVINVLGSIFPNSAIGEGIGHAYTFDHSIQKCVATSAYWGNNMSGADDIVINDNIMAGLVASEYGKFDIERNTLSAGALVLLSSRITDTLQFKDNKIVKLDATSVSVVTDYLTSLLSGNIIRSEGSAIRVYNKQAGVYQIRYNRFESTGNAQAFF